MITVTLNDVCQALSAWTGLPPERLQSGWATALDPDQLRTQLAGAVIGQESAIGRTVRALERRFRLQPRPDERRPLWTALFAGPSGVGKTQLAKEIARALFGETDRYLVQIDLSDFKNQHTVARLVGAPPGYVGHDRGGELTDALRRSPSGVLLLDEVEKAHPAVLTQVLLPMLGEGVVHDMNDGRRLDASQYVVIMTSKLGNKPTQLGAAGFCPPDGDSRRSLAAKAIREFFSKEILGRINDLVLFNTLPLDALKRIWAAELDRICANLSGDKAQVSVGLGPEVTDHLLAGAEAELQAEGVRALRRLADRLILDNCLRLLDGSRAGGRIEVVLTAEGGLRFRLREHPNLNSCSGVG